MYIRTIAFFGHRIVDDYFEIERQVEKLVRSFVYDGEYVEFLVGRSGQFDELVTSVIRRVKSEMCDEYSSLVLVLPYVTTQSGSYWKELKRFYDVIEVCEESANVHYKAAYSIRNQKMVERAETVVCYVKREEGGAYDALKYAEKARKEIVRLDCSRERV
ncbi:MAG: hypothetical protein IJO24_07875 [Clostridia bacterium]|nr:hypothetical protein [Clostridia bacterium]